MYKKIIVPLDNSATDDTILTHIRRLARLTNAQLVLVHVADGFDARSVLVHGKEPVEGILSVAQNEACDLIAMATHGHQFIEDMILGSVADTLRHSTDIPILMIRSSLK